MALKAVFGSCKSISGKYSIFRKCYFPENIPFSGNAIFRKGKYFHVFGYISKNFLKNIFWCLEKKKKKTNQTNPEEGRRDRTAIVEIAIDGAIASLVNRRRRRSRSRRSTSSDDRRSRSLDDHTARRSTSALVGRSRRSSIGALRSGLSLLSLSLPDLGSLFSLSLSLFPKMN